MKLALLALSLGSAFSVWGGTDVWAASSHTYDADSKTDTFINAGISKNYRANDDKKKNFVGEYDHPDRDLVIHWGQAYAAGSPPDNNPIRDSVVKAKNITIVTQNVSYPGPEITDKAVYADDQHENDPDFDRITIVSAQNKIDITSDDDGFYAQGGSQIKVQDFKELHVVTDHGYGIVDNAGGITVTGRSTDDSTVYMETKDGPRPDNKGYRHANRAVLGNTYHAKYGQQPQGTELSIKKVGTITLKAGGQNLGLFSGYGGNPGKNYEHDRTFKIDLDAASKVDITGQIKGLNGDITINTKTVNFKLGAEQGQDVIDASEGSVITINENGQNSSIKGNIKAAKDAAANDPKADKQTKVTINSEGNAFTLTGDLISSDHGKIDVSILGSGSQMTGKSVNGGENNVTLASDAKWNITADSEVNNLKFNSESAIASLAGDARTLKINDLSGSGTFLMDLTYKGDNVTSYRDSEGSDYIMAKKGSGTHKVSLTDESSVSGMKDGSKLYFASTGANTSTFQANQNVTVMQKSNISDKVLTVKKDTEGTDDNWYLTLADKPEEPDNPVNPINPNGFVPGKVFNSALALWRENDALHKRLGELRYDENEEGLWARFTNMRLERGGSHSFHSNYKNLQIGADKKAIRTNGEWYYGGAFEHLWGKPTYSDGWAEQKLTDFALYGTNVKANDSFIDYTFKVGRIDSDYDTTYGDHGSFDNWAMAIGAEYGKRYTLKDNWTIEPQAQLTYNYLWGDDYTTKNGARVNQDNADSLVGRLGFLFAREIHPELTTPSRVYFKASILHDFLGDTTSTIADDIKFTDNDDLGDTWYTVGFGTDLRIKDGMQFYFDAEKNFGAEVSMKYRFNAGIRMAF